MNLMRQIFVLLMVFALSSPAATIKFFTDYPNSVPVGSDFFVLQRNQSYINASRDQVKNDWFNNPIFTGTITGDGSGLTNVNNMSQTVSNFNATFITNFMEFSTNLFVTQEFVTNLYATTEIVTNLYATTEIVTNLFVTNLFALNGNFIQDNNGNGTNTSFWGTTYFDELDVLNAYLTNAYTFITNAQYLKTDGDGKIIRGTGLPATNVLLSAGANITFTTNVDGTIVITGSATNIIDTSTNNLIVVTNIIVYSNLTVLQNIYANTNFSTNLYFVSGKGNTLIVTNVAVYGTQTNFNIAASSAVITKSDQVLTNAVNAHGVFTNSATGPPSFGLVQDTELQSSYTVQTNNGGGAALVGGANGVSATVYLTNITAATTLASFTWPTTRASGIKIYVTCSGGTDRVLTFPNGCTGAGYGTPPAITVTNAKAAYFDVICIPGVSTNVFWSPVF